MSSKTLQALPDDLADHILGYAPHLMVVPDGHEGHGDWVAQLASPVGDAELMELCHGV